MLEIIQASYGNKDVTELIKSKIRNNTINIIATNETMGGDPQYGMTKKFTCTYKFNGEVGSYSCKEKDHISIPHKNATRLGIYYTNNNHDKTIHQTLSNLEKIYWSNPDLTIITCSHKPLHQYPFRNIDSIWKESSQPTLISQMLRAMYEAKRLGGIKFVSFLEHDVMYPPEYFQYPEFRNLYLYNSNYLGVCAGGFQRFKPSWVPMSQITMRFDAALTHLESIFLASIDAGAVAWMEPQGNARSWPCPHPSVHINRPSLTNHKINFSEVFAETLDPWGHWKDVWTGE